LSAENLFLSKKQVFSGENRMFRSIQFHFYLTE